MPLGEFDCDNFLSSVDYKIDGRITIKSAHINNVTTLNIKEAPLVTNKDLYHRPKHIPKPQPHEICVEVVIKALNTLIRPS
jgi:hypothetical protein